MTMTKYFLSLKFYTRHAIEMDEEIKEISHQSKDDLLKFTSENNKEVLEIKLNDLLYIESADNYSKFYFRKNGQIATSILRTSLSRVEKAFLNPELFRCHRTYIVQLRNVERVSGNSQGYRFHFAGGEDAVPVSRRMNGVIHERLAGVKD
jgi:DNA-binding LytR/AlgR family response regulator